MDPYSPGAQAYLLPPPNIPPALEPITVENSAVADDVESDLQQAVIAVFEATLRPALQQLNVYGAPHRADFDTLERFIKAAGLALDRRPGEEAYMRELFRAWVARNPRRGLAYLKLALSLLYDGIHTVDQLWQDPARPYPGGASPVPGPTKWLTSRVRVTLDAAAGLTPAELYRARSIMMSVVPARIVLELSVDLGDQVESQVGIAAASGAEQYFTWVFAV